MATPECLRYAGIFGHQWCVTATYPSKGVEDIYAHVNTGEQAVKAFDENKYSTAIYTRTRKGWRKVRRSAAVLDS